MTTTNNSSENNVWDNYFKCMVKPDIKKKYKECTQQKNIPNNVDTSNIEKIESLNCETINDLYSCLPSCVCNVYDTILKDNADRNKNFFDAYKRNGCIGLLKCGPDKLIIGNQDEDVESEIENFFTERNIMYMSIAGVVLLLFCCCCLFIMINNR